MCCKTHSSRGENIFADLGTSLISLGGTLTIFLWQGPYFGLLVALGGYVLAPPALRYVWRFGRKIIEREVSRQKVLVSGPGEEQKQAVLMAEKILREARRKNSILFSLGVWCLMILIVSPEILFWFRTIVKNELGLTRTKVLGTELEREKSTTY